MKTINYFTLRALFTALSVLVLLPASAQKKFLEAQRTLREKSIRYYRNEAAKVFKMRNEHAFEETLMANFTTVQIEAFMPVDSLNGASQLPPVLQQFQEDTTEIARFVTDRRTKFGLFRTLQALEVNFQALQLKAIDLEKSRNALKTKSNNAGKWMSWFSGGTAFVSGIGGAISSISVTVISATLGLANAIISGNNQNKILTALLEVNGDLAKVAKHESVLIELKTEFIGNLSFADSTKLAAYALGWNTSVANELTAIYGDFPALNPVSSAVPGAGPRH